MRALGVARADVFLVFVFQSIIVGIFASAVGLLAAVATAPSLDAYIVTKWTELAPAVKQIGGLFQVGWGTSFIVVATVVGICVFAALLPSLHAASKTPMDALREH
jgi:ABC-type lipoprotein release transport system permease subunit